MPLHNLVNQIL